MTIQTTLPRINELGYYEMRLESIGGLGANLCGKLLGELGAVQLGLNAASFSSYGSEKRGSPVKASSIPPSGIPTVWPYFMKPWQESCRLTPGYSGIAGLSSIRRWTEPQSGIGCSCQRVISTVLMP